MKKIYSFLFVLFVSLVFIGCNKDQKYTITYDLDGGTCYGLISEYQSGFEVVLPEPTKEGYIFLGWYNGDEKVEKVKGGNFNLVAKWEKVEEESKYDIITIAQALELATEAGENGTADRYYIKGIIKELSNAQYGEMTVEDETGEIYVYGTYDKDGEKRYSELDNKPVAGDEVILYCILSTYKDSPQVKSGWIIEYVDNSEDKPVVLPEGDTLTVAQAIELANQVGENGTEKRYYIKGTVKTVSNPQYGEMTIKDETGEIYVYGTYDKDGVKRYSELDDKPIAGDEITLYCILSTYKGTPQVKSGWITDFKHVEVEIDPNEYVAKTIDETRKSSSGIKVTVEGVVAYITYANGFIPNGFFLVDNTGSIYVYGEVASQVAVGNKIKLAGERIHYMASDAASNAEAFGYLGATQIANSVILENDKGTNDFDKSWITESTVKEILETPASEDITSNIYKVNALVVKSVNPGFVNYYIDDLDGTTGSYVYTQCNGNDFSWLDEFDQKICTVYLSPLNAKVTTSNCQYRFIPVAVSFDNYAFDEKEAAQFALDYYAVDQFLASYKSDPALELLTTVDNELLGFNGVALSYASNNESVVKFTVGDKVVMNALANGTAEITVTATYKTYTATETFSITVNLLGEVETITVKECLESENGTICTVKGIVAASCVNQPAFYLIDETGVIAVRTTEDVLATLKVGNEVIMKGTKVVYESSKGLTQQICLLDSELVINYYGEHQYSKASFDSSKTLADLADLSTDEFHTTQVYVLNVKIKFVEQAYFSNCYITSEDGSVEMLLYTSSGSQYSWLKEFGEGVVTIELCLCDWNNKADYRGCVLSATNGEKTINNTLNFK